MRCNDVLEKLDYYIEEALSDNEKSRILAHLEQCPGCKKEYLELKGMRNILKDTPKVTPPSDFTQYIMNRLPDGKRSIVEEWYDYISTPYVLKWSVAVISLVLIFGLGIFLYRVRNFAPGEQIVNVRFQLELPENHGVKTVSLTGDFNGWDMENMQLRPVKEGLWEIEGPLKKGRYQYMFVVNGERWMPDPRSHKLVNDGFGGKNSLLEI